MAPTKNNPQKKMWRNNTSASNTVYGLGFVGALVFYFQHATTLTAYVIGLGKAILWPAFMVYSLLGFLKM